MVLFRASNKSLDYVYRHSAYTDWHSDLHNIENVHISCKETITAVGCFCTNNANAKSVMYNFEMELCWVSGVTNLSRLRVSHLGECLMFNLGIHVDSLQCSVICFYCIVC